MSAINNPQLGAAAAAAGAAMAAMPAAAAPVSKKLGTFIQIPFPILQQVFSYFELDTQIHALHAQVQCLNKEHRDFVEFKFYGQLDFQNKQITKAYLEERNKLQEPLSKLDKEINAVKAEMEKPCINNWFDLRDRLKQLEYQRKILTPYAQCYDYAMMRNRHNRKIMHLFGGRKKFEAKPVLQLSDKRLQENYIRVSPHEMSAAIMRSPDNSERMFFAVRFREKESYPVVLVIFQRYPNSESWADKEDDVIFNIPGHFISHGKMTPKNLSIYGELQKLIGAGRVEIERQPLILRPPSKYHLELCEENNKSNS